MADPVRIQLDPSAYYGAILSNALERGNTAQMWQRIKETAVAMTGVPESEIVFQPGILGVVNNLRANATAVALAARNLQAARPEQALVGGTLIGTPIYARPLDYRQGLPKFEAKAKLSVQTAAGPIDQWITVQYGADLPDTVGQLMADLEVYANDMYSTYGDQLLGWSDPVLNAI